VGSLYLLRENKITKLIMQKANNNNSKKKTIRQAIQKVAKKYKNNKGPSNFNKIFGIPRKIFPSNAVDFRKLSKSNLVGRVNEYAQNTRAKYLAGLVHPDIAVQNQFPVKCYTDLPIPTATIGFHEQYQFTTSNVGTFLLSWRPGFLLTEGRRSTLGSNASNITYNNNAALTGLSGNANNTFVAKGYYPNVSLQRMRLVSALIRVSYNGSVLNQAGTMLSCAVFDSLPIAVLTSAVTDDRIDRYGNFSIIQNGLWNKTTDITNSSSGLECLYIPMDPDDFMFQQVDTYYGTSIGGGLSYPDAEGAHINYILCGKNLPANTSCILVDVYYNWEVIADPTSAPILRGDQPMCDPQMREDTSKVVQNLSTNGGLIREANTKFNWKDALNDLLNMGVKFLPSLLSAI